MAATFSFLLFTFYFQTANVSGAYLLRFKNYFVLREKISYLGIYKLLNNDNQL